MTLMMHLCPLKELEKIKRHGIKKSKTFDAVFAVPVTPDYLVTHQWSRELTNDGHGPRAAVYFEVPDDSEVEAGHFGDRDSDRRVMTASQAASLLRTTDRPFGFEVRIPFRIEPSAIRRSRFMTKPVGWRHFPGSNGRAPMIGPAPDRGPDDRLPQDEERSERFSSLPPGSLKLRWAGEFAEAGYDDNPSVLDVPWEPLTSGQKALLVSYLRDSSTVLHDYSFWWAGEDLEVETDESVHSDGLWVWGSHLADLVERFDVKVPDGLLQRALTSEGPCKLRINDRRRIGKELLRRDLDDRVEYDF